MFEADRFMSRALELARLGEGAVAPNPMVGCVLVQENRIVGEGYHRNHGGPHAEIEALAAAGDLAFGATAYVTLEPCSHFGKTPPCTSALIAAGIGKVVLAMHDPNPQVNGKGIEQLRKAGIEVIEAVLEDQARELNVKYLTRIEKKRPWVLAKWAMTLDGKIASRTGSSQWVSSEGSREIVHELRAKMDAILIGSGTARWDDPSLTVRLDEKKVSKKIRGGPAESPEKSPPKTPLRIVLDSSASIAPESRLVRTAREAPVLLGVGPDASLENIQRLREAGCEVLVLPGRIKKEPQREIDRIRSRDFRPGPLRRHRQPSISRREEVFSQAEQVYRERLVFLLAELARRGITDLMLEGGGELLGSFLDARMIDEVHVFLAPKLIGGREAVSAITGRGLAEMWDAYRIESPLCQVIAPDIYISGRVRYPGGG